MIQKLYYGKEIKIIIKIILSIDGNYYNIEPQNLKFNIFVSIVIKYLIK